MGNLIQQQFLQARDWAFEALSVMLAVLLLGAIMFYIRRVGRTSWRVWVWEKMGADPSTMGKIPDRALFLFAGLIYLFFYAPIFVMVFFSFNEGRSTQVWAASRPSGTGSFSRTSRCSTPSAPR